MEFNPYIWQLYKNSPEGSLTIQVFSNLFERIVDGSFTLPTSNMSLNTPDWVWEFTKIVIDDYSSVEIKSVDEAGKILNELASGFPVTFYDEDEGAEEEIILTHADLLEWLTELSVGLYICFPEYFFPYFFKAHFYLFEQICTTFDIPLPELPKKKYLDKRLMYYFELCQALHEFRRSQNLSPAELCAFLYSFALNFISLEIDNDLPKPMKVWIVGGGINDNGDPEFLDRADNSTISNWQGNVDTRRGDIVLVYCLAPRSSIHSVWRAKADGFIDPFMYFYSQIWVCEPIKIVPVTYEDLRNDPLLSQSGLVRSSMQGLNGRRFTFQEYQAILQIMERKGQDISTLPRIEPLLDVGDDAPLLKDERDVEINLIEPFLEKLGYKTEDWTRQMPVRMGSGEKIYPDYAFFAKQNKGEEQARMVLEAKYRLRTQKELFKAYWQAKSYALRLQASVFVLGAIEGIWIFELTKTGFAFEKHEHKTWQEIYQPDIFPNLLDLIGKQTINKLKKKSQR